VIFKEYHLKSISIENTSKERGLKILSKGVSVNVTSKTNTQTFLNAERNQHAHTHTHTPHAKF
jgi:hypothetical protein